MKFKVSGVNHNTGARMTLEFDATSKAAAEKTAQGQGMEVLHCHETHEDDAGIQVERKTHRGAFDDPPSRRGLYVVLVVAVAVAIAAVLFWSRIRAMIGH